MNQEKKSFQDIDFSHLEDIAAKLIEMEIGRIDGIRFAASGGPHTGRMLGNKANLVIMDDHIDSASYWTCYKNIGDGRGWVAQAVTMATRELPEPKFFTPKIPDKSARALHAPKPRKRW